MIRRGEIRWADFGEPRGSRPAKYRPAVVVQDNRYNHSRLATAVIIAITSNLDYARHPGNVLLPAPLTGLQKDSVVNVTAVTTVNKTELSGPVGLLPERLLAEVDAGLRQVLGL